MYKKIAVTLFVLGALSSLLFSYKAFTSRESGDNKNLESFFTKYNPNENVREAYKFALENPQNVLSTVKCYCGCLEQDHKNSRDCFINSDGSFDLMGLNCGLCVKTALLSKAMLSEGKSVEEISLYVDSKWGRK